MFLKSLEIFGFKSFADRTKIEFQDGVTALLGPNGCGKSNVVDAVKWVLAESRSKNLRADKMEDVIFNGTQTRPPLNVAEVILTIDNEKKLLPLDVPEIEVKRRLYRSGENEYSINNKVCTATAVRRLFLDTGVGKAAYSVMEQGKVNQILSSKPEDRRYFFEEAAGISRTKEEYAQAERDLAKAREYLCQKEAQVIELKHNYDTLKVQAEQTSTWRELKDKIFDLELDIQLLKLRGFLHSRDEKQKQKDITENNRQQIRQEIDTITSTLSITTDKMKEMQDKLNTNYTQVATLEVECRQKKEREKERATQKQELDAKATQLELRISNLTSQIEDTEEEIDCARADLLSKKKQLENITKNIDEFSKNIQHTTKQVQDNNKTCLDNENRIQTLLHKEQDLQKNLKYLTEDIVSQLDLKLKNAGYSTANLQANKQEITSLINKLKILSKGRQDVCNDFCENPTISSNNIATFVKDLSASFSQVLEMLKQIEIAFSNYEKASPAFIDDFLSPEGIITQKRNIDNDILQIKNQVNDIQKLSQELKETNITLQAKIEGYKDTLSNLKLSQIQMQTQLESSDKEIKVLERSLNNLHNQLQENTTELSLTKKSIIEVQEAIQDIQEDISSLEWKGKKLLDDIQQITQDIQEFKEQSCDKQNQLAKKNEELLSCQATYEKLNNELYGLESDIRNVNQNFIDTHSRDLSEFRERMESITTTSMQLRESLATTRSLLSKLGQVNLMAPEEFIEVKDRYEKSTAAIEDLRQSMEHEERLAQEMRSSSSQKFIDTYNKIKKNFHNMFRRLFGGGRAELHLVNAEDVLTTGIDIYAQPPGKKLENISLLSGGEKTMTAVALLFATYQVKPSPFCLLDEIDAALDNKNVSTFVATLKAFSNISQYIVITHNSATAAGTATLLGITMEEDGVSKLATIRLSNDYKSSEDIDINEDFVEEDVDLELGITLPQRPAQRIHNEDGTVTDPESEHFAQIVAQKISENLGGGN